eukprot:Em0765g4a
MAGRAGGSPTFSPQRLERPDDRLHARRPSDESEQIIRMSNMLHLPNKPLPSPPLPIHLLHARQSFQRLRGSRDESHVPRCHGTQRHGSICRLQRQLPAFGHGRRPPYGEMSPRPGRGVEEYRGVFSPESQQQLFPPLSMSDRHPPLPQLASILSSQLGKTENMVSMDAMATEPQRPRSSSMPGYQRRVPLAPQISISSPDELVGENSVSKPF